MSNRYAHDRSNGLVELSSSISSLGVMIVISASITMPDCVTAAPRARASSVEAE